MFFTEFSGVEEITSKLTVYISDFKSSKKFEPVPLEVTKVNI